MRYVTQLVGNAFGVANDTVDVTVGMTVNPVFYLAIGNEVEQLYSEGSIDSAALDL